MLPRRRVAVANGFQAAGKQAHADSAPMPPRHRLHEDDDVLAQAKVERSSCETYTRATVIFGLWRLRPDYLPEEFMPHLFQAKHFTLA